MSQNHSETPWHSREGRQQNDKCRWGSGETGTLGHSWWQRKWCCQSGKQSGSFFKKLNINLPYVSAFPLSGIYAREIKASVQTQTHVNIRGCSSVTVPNRKQSEWPPAGAWTGQWQGQSTDTCDNRAHRRCEVKPDTEGPVPQDCMRVSAEQAGRHRKQDSSCLGAGHMQALAGKGTGETSGRRDAF